MNSTDLLDRFRTDVKDDAKPYLWSDEEIYSNIDDAQKMFCRLIDGLPDATSVATSVAYAIDEAWLALHPSIIKIRAARFGSTGRPITVVNYEDLTEHCIKLDGKTGNPHYLVIGMETDKALFYPTPVAADTLVLLIDRLPLKRITCDGDQKLEIPEEHHLHLLDWVKHLAYLKQDAETLDKRASADFETEFRRYCETARKEKERKKHKTRIVQYGGI